MLARRGRLLTRHSFYVIRRAVSTFCYDVARFAHELIAALLRYFNVALIFAARRCRGYMLFHVIYSSRPSRVPKIHPMFRLYVALPTFRPSPAVYAAIDVFRRWSYYLR